MFARNDALQNGLRCLGSPWTLLCIAILVFNDHYLKAVYPSWLTGKLSDFAGLYFFPFIVAAGLAALFPRLRESGNKTGLIAFGGVAIWFVLLKTFAPVNDLTVAAISAVTGRQVQLILDPSDAMALVVLVPAWRAWTSAAPFTRRARSYTALALGVGACLATSPPLPVVESATHLSTQDDALIVFDANVTYTAAISLDAGNTWSPMEAAGEVAIPATLPALPITACLPDDRDQCYRITGEPDVELSLDGGKTWGVAWEPPSERILFMRRTSAPLDIATYDLLVMRRKGDTYVFVAMGREGILRKELPDGDWTRMSVQGATPTPYGAANVLDAAVTMKGELVAWALLSLIALIFACGVLWNSASRFASAPLSRFEWIYSPALSPLYGFLAALIIEGAILLALATLAPLVSPNLDAAASYFLLAIAGACMLLGLASWPAIIYGRLNRWRMLLLKQGASKDAARSMVLTAYASHAGFLVAGSIPWLLWAMGTISNYGVALSLAVLASLVTAYILLRYLHRISNVPNTFSAQGSSNPETMSK